MSFSNCRGEWLGGGGIENIPLYGKLRNPQMRAY